MRVCFGVEGEQAQESLGLWLAARLPDAALVFLTGDLGAGKTTLVRGLVQALGHSGRVKSPTYTLIEPYEIGKRKLYHMDLYRLADGEELEYLGLREMLAEQALLLVEWPQRGQGWLPDPDLAISIEHADTARRVCLDSPNDRLCDLLSEASEAFLD